jgi:DNA-directed RNA polymerase specialized sigma24 family protein
MGSCSRRSRGGRRGFALFYRRHLPGVVGYLVRETGDREVSADLAAEVFAAVLLVARRFRARGGGSAVWWVRGIARNKLRESWRRGRVEDRAGGVWRWSRRCWTMLTSRGSMSLLVGQCWRA